MTSRLKGRKCEGELGVGGGGVGQVPNKGKYRCAVIENLGWQNFSN